MILFVCCLVFYLLFFVSSCFACNIFVSVFPVCGYFVLHRFVFGIFCICVFDLNGLIKNDKIHNMHVIMILQP